MSSLTSEAIEQRLLHDLQSNSKIASSLAYAALLSVSHEALVGTLKSLETAQMVATTLESSTALELTSEGSSYAKDGSPEARVLSFVHASPEHKISVDEINAKLGEIGKFGLAAALRNKWLSTFTVPNPNAPADAPAVEPVADGTDKQKKKEKKTSTDTVMVQCAADISLEDQTKSALLKIQENGSQDAVDAKVLDSLKKRKLVQLSTKKFFSITKGAEFALERKKLELDLTPQMIATGSWKTAEFKPYNFAASGQPPAGGCLHPLLKVRAQFREIFLELGFEEMPTNAFVESSFWNFDALFQPQQHPARDAHDTFFLSDPATAPALTLSPLMPSMDRLGPADKTKKQSEDDKPAIVMDDAYVQRVKDVHEKGGYGSIGYRYNWRQEEASKNVLRTHTTAVSSRVLKRLADDWKAECTKAGKTVEFQPRKFFSIDRVFRNEMMDATHLCEFHQVEGMVVDNKINLGTLMGVIKQFFSKIGIHNVRFKPAYNPYTEPSMEIFGFHPQLKRWVEIGNSGVFRPEMLLPMGLPADVKVVAWGLSLERPTMILYEIDNIRDLLGHKQDIGKIRSNPICRIHQ
nr:phenylalanyl-tRNA synthetase alpha subunit [Andalucia godoyi]